jgi:hypothetical protein
MSEQNLPPPEPTSAPEPEGSRRRSRTLTLPSNLPRWIGLMALAAIPAVVAGLLVYFLAGGGSSGGGNNGLAASIVDGFLRLGGSTDDNIQSFGQKLPPGYPGDLPAYPGASLIASFTMSSNQGVTYLALYESSDSVSKVMRFYTDRLDKDPWQLEAAQNSSASTGVRFNKPADPDIDGSVSVNHSDLDPRTTVYVSVQDSSASARSAKPPGTKFTPSPSLALPPGFPGDFPIFAGKEASTITDTLFQRDSGSTSYLVSFVTKSDQGDIIDYYRNEFQKRGWTVNDSKPSSSTSFSQGLDFQDGPNKGFSGTVSADKFASDRNYTKVDLEVDVSSSRGKRN